MLKIMMNEKIYRVMFVLAMFAIGGMGAGAAHSNIDHVGHIDYIQFDTLSDDDMDAIAAQMNDISVGE